MWGFRFQALSTTYSELNSHLNLHRHFWHQFSIALTIYFHGINHWCIPLKSPSFCESIGDAWGGSEAHLFEIRAPEDQAGMDAICTGLFTFSAEAPMLTDSPKGHQKAVICGFSTRKHSWIDERRQAGRYSIDASQCTCHCICADWNSSNRSWPNATSWNAWV